MIKAELIAYNRTLSDIFRKLKKNHHDPDDFIKFAKTLQDITKGKS